jgi:hypothetical protein
MSQRPSVGSSSTLPPDAGEVATAVAADGEGVGVDVDVEPGEAVPVGSGVRVGVDVGVAVDVGKVGVGNTDEVVGVGRGESWAKIKASPGTEGADGRAASSASKLTSVMAMGEERRAGQEDGALLQPVSLHGSSTRYVPKAASPKPEILSTYTYKVACLTSVPSGSASIGKWR